MHASMPPKRTSRRLRGYPPEPQGRGEVGSADGEASPPRGASPPPGFARVDYGHGSGHSAHQDSTSRRSPTSTTPATREDLLSLRRDYHRAATQTLSATHHLAFLETCLEDSIVPKGLRLQLSPQIYKASASNVAQKIATILGDAEKSIIKALAMHYRYLKREGTKSMKSTDSQMSLFSSSLPPSSSTGKDHEEALEKTKNNLERKKEQLSQRATRKLEALRKPQDKEHTRTHKVFRKVGPRTAQHHNTVPRDQRTGTTHTTQIAYKQKLTPPFPHTHPHTHNTQRKHTKNTPHPPRPLLPTPPPLLPLLLPPLPAISPLLPHHYPPCPHPPPLLPLPLPLHPPHTHLPLLRTPPTGLGGRDGNAW